MKKVISVLLAALMLTAVFAVSVAAETYPSVGNRDYYVIDITVDEEDEGGSVHVDPTTVPKGEETTITATPDEGSVFDHWEITGEYEIVEGDLNSPTIVIRPIGDVKVIAHFKGAKGPEKDGGKTSPTTGYNTTAAVAVVMAVIFVSASAVVYTGKRYFSAK